MSPSDVVTVGPEFMAAIRELAELNQRHEHVPGFMAAELAAAVTILIVQGRTPEQVSELFGVACSVARQGVAALRAGES